MLRHNIKKLSLSVLKFYKTRSPIFEHLDYTLLIISNQPYLLLSWKAKHHTYLSIPSVNFISFKKAGSMYIKLNKDYERLTIGAGNLWRKTTMEMNFQKIIIDRRINFENVLLEQQKIQLRKDLKWQKNLEISPVFDFSTIQTHLPDVKILNKEPVLISDNFLPNQNY